MAMDLTGRRSVVIGAGASGLAATALLRKRGAHVVVDDSRSREALGARAAELEALGATLADAPHQAATFADADLVVLSPGVPPLPVLAEVAARGVEVIGEVELAARLLSGVLIGITGTNGKSTVTTLVGEMLERSGFATFLGGNLGVPLSEAVGGPADTPEGRIVVELSSFQLEHVERLRPRVAALLNVTDDHLDRYEDFAHYARTKGRIFAAQGEGDHALVPDGDPAVCALLPASGPAVHRFGGASGEVRVEALALRDDVSGLAVPTAEIRLQGRHNVENAAAAVLAARLVGGTAEGMERALREVGGLPHRVARVGEREGVLFIDDSKATNVGATCASLDGLASAERRAVLILGGVDKGGSYAPLAARLAEVGRAAIVIGAATELITRALGGLSIPVEAASSMAEAVERAAAFAREGDLVLLAPACSSFDMYRSYAHRGDDFAASVRALGGVS